MSCKSTDIVIYIQQLNETSDKMKIPDISIIYFHFPKPSNTQSFLLLNSGFVHLPTLSLKPSMSDVMTYQYKVPNKSLKTTRYTLLIVALFQINRIAVNIEITKSVQPQHCLTKIWNIDNFMLIESENLFSLRIHLNYLV